MGDSDVSYARIFVPLGCAGVQSRGRDDKHHVVRRVYYNWAGYGVRDIGYSKRRPIPLAPHDPFLFHQGPARIWRGWHARMRTVDMSCRFVHDSKEAARGFLERLLGSPQIDISTYNKFTKRIIFEASLPCGGDRICKVTERVSLLMIPCRSCGGCCVCGCSRAPRGHRDRQTDEGF